MQTAAQAAAAVTMTAEKEDPLLSSLRLIWDFHGRITMPHDTWSLQPLTRLSFHWQKTWGKTIQFGFSLVFTNKTPPSSSKINGQYNSRNTYLWRLLLQDFLLTRLRAAKSMLFFFFIEVGSNFYTIVSMKWHSKSFGKKPIKQKKRTVNSIPKKTSVVWKRQKRKPIFRQAHRNSPTP